MSRIRPHNFHQVLIFPGLVYPVLERQPGRGNRFFFVGKRFAACRRARGTSILLFLSTKPRPRLLCAEHSGDKPPTLGTCY
jgi:hypothetical protein